MVTVCLMPETMAFVNGRRRTWGQHSSQNMNSREPSSSARLNKDREGVVSSCNESVNEKMEDVSDI